MRPSILIPLFASVESIYKLGLGTKRALMRIECSTILSLLWHLPIGTQQRHSVSSLRYAVPGELIKFRATVLQHFPGFEKFKTSSRRPYRVAVGDDARFLDLIFFGKYTQYLEKLLPVGEARIITGKLENYQGKLQISHPDSIQEASQSSILDHHEILPVYGLTQGLLPAVLFKLIARAENTIPQLPEWISSETLSQQKWQPWSQALKSAHHPQESEENLNSTSHRKRLAFDELFAHQLALMIIRRSHQKDQGQAILPTGYLQQKILAVLPFKLTPDQIKSLQEIDHDLRQPYRMIRLLQGDVGSGKTIVAFISMIKAVEGGFQSALLAPTEILAKQHFSTMLPWAQALNIELELLVGKEPLKVKRYKHLRLKEGHIQIVVGTHALVQDAVKFKNLGLIVVDEQHRFGVEQRLKLAEKGLKVDVLSMTATPIPRTLMLALYGDLSSSILRQKPQGRVEIVTKAIGHDRLEEVIQGIERALKNHQKIYWICPLVTESELLDLTAAQDRYQALSARFPGCVGIIHGKLKSMEKDTIMNDFRESKIQILVATTVIEVGVDVPDATIMIIEHAERFGLAQLHQLRGRVGRGSQASTCILLYYKPINSIAKSRIDVMRHSNDGFKIAEEDLKLRGGGDALGLKQSGLPQFRLVDLTVHEPLLALAHQEALTLLTQDPNLQTARGQAARILLAMFGLESAMRLLQAA